MYAHGKDSEGVNKDRGKQGQKTRDTERERERKGKLRSFQSGDCIKFVRVTGFPTKD